MSPSELLTRPQPQVTGYKDSLLHNFALALESCTQWLGWAEVLVKEGGFNRADDPMLCHSHSKYESNDPYQAEIHRVVQARDVTLTVNTNLTTPLKPKSIESFRLERSFSTSDVLCYVAVDAFGFHQSYSLVHTA
ncbi:hypothetical protein SFRURICE_018318 [Spodoptera frugiperda]|nr:hypothetical protein SFRURICE_018318 [Spodoptera frugiperda]